MERNVSMLKPEGYQVESHEISGWKVNVTSYSFGGQYYCHIDNVDPGAIIARTEAPTREEATLLAMMKAKDRLKSRAG